MVQVNELRGIIYKCGLSQRKVAEMLGISEKTFYEKMKKGVFSTTEASAISRILKIEDPASIFFASDVT